MLYKKIHRQYIRKFRKGRKYKLYGDGVVREITREPYIEKDDNGNYISTDRWYLISLDSGEIMTGILRNITWLD